MLGRKGRPRVLGSETMLPQRDERRACTGLRAVLAMLLGLSGCASPGPPRPPSLLLPEPVHRLTAERTGNHVRLEFLVPERTTDHVALRDRALGLAVCREEQPGVCAPVHSGMPPTVKPGTLVQVDDRLPASLSTGPVRALRYRVELKNARGRSAGASEAALTAAGSAPAPVARFRAEGSRRGVLLRWQPEAGDDAVVLVDRAGGTKSEPLISADRAATARLGMLVDASAAEGVRYEYVAHRERKVEIEGHSVLVRGAASEAVPFTLHDVYPPPVPTDLTVAAFHSGDGAYGVDLVWEPVDDAGLAGYNVYRSLADAPGSAVKLNPKPLTAPGFHDATANAALEYRWSVTAVDRKGNESAPVTGTAAAR